LVVAFHTFATIEAMIRTIFFDLDGTLADTEPLHFEAFGEGLRIAGIELSRDDYFSRLIGYSDHDCIALLLREHGTPASPERMAELIERKAALYQAMIAGRDVTYPGAVEFVRRCRERFPLMLVTGTLRAEAELILGHAGIRDLFVDVIAAEDVDHGKPQPDPFLAGLGRIGFILRPHPSIVGAECLVIEDTAAGVESAHRAGMRVLAVCHTAPAKALSAADLIRPSLCATDLDDILHRLANF
jgi:HAD superfamily hydrolase (TIGR01509 family)